MKGTVYKRKDKYAFQFSYNIFVNFEKQTKKISVSGFETREEAIIKLNQAMIEFKSVSIDLFNKNKFLPEKRKINISKMENILLKFLEYKKNFLKQSSYTVEVNKVNSLSKTLKDKTLTEINSINFLNDFILKQPKYKILTLKEVLNFAVSNLRIITENNLNKLKIKKAKNEMPKIKFFSKDELKTIFNTENEHFNLFCKTLYYTGLRKGELLALTFEDIILRENASIYLNIYKSLYDGVITTTKTKESNRAVDIPIFLYKALVEYKNKYKISDIQPLFSLYNISRTVKVIKNKNIDFNFHKFRHTHTSELVLKNIPLKEIQARLGHSTSKTTLEIYSHFIKNNSNNIADCLTEI